MKLTQLEIGLLNFVELIISLHYPNVVKKLPVSTDFRESHSRSKTKRHKYLNCSQ